MIVRKYNNARVATSKYILNSGSLRKKKGVVLVVALVMLLVMTSLGVTTMTGSALQERISSNHRQQYIARTNADAALRSAEAFLNSLPTAGVGEFLTVNDIQNTFGVVDGNGDFPTGLYTAQQFLNGNGPVNLFTNLTDANSWNQLNSVDVTNTPGNQFDIALSNTIVGANPPRVVIQYLGCESPDTVNCDDPTENAYFSFRIVAIGWGADQNAYSVLQAIYLSKQP